MHPIQEKLLKLSKNENLAKLSLREMASRIGTPKESPQKVKHHLLQLQKKGFLMIDRFKGIMRSRAADSRVSTDRLINKQTNLLFIPVIGTANCGPATIFAEENFQGFLRISSKLVGRTKSANLFAIKTDGASMNRAEIAGKRIEDGDYVIIDSKDKDLVSGEVVLAIIDDKATIKRFINDTENKQIVLRADSSFDYEPTYLHPEDDFSINGKVVAVIKKPRL